MINVVALISKVQMGVLASDHKGKTRTTIVIIKVSTEFIDLPGKTTHIREEIQGVVF